MKKPRKQKPKARHRATKPAVSPRRALYSSPRHAVSTDAPFLAGALFRASIYLHASQKRLSAFGTSSAATASRRLDELLSFARVTAPNEARAALRRIRDEARALALPYSHDEREVLALLFLPFLLVASAIVVSQTVRNLAAHMELVAVHAPERELGPVRPGASPPPVAAVQPSARAVPAPVATLNPITAAPPSQQTIQVEPSLPALSAGPELEAAAPAAPPAKRPEIALLAPAPMPRATPVPNTLPPGLTLQPLDGGQTLAPLAPTNLDSYEADADGRPIPGLCVAANAPTKPIAAALPVAPRSLTPEAFGRHLAAAAEAQAGDFVIYNDRYRAIRYPMGDVAPLYGVCTDVVVRAYRTLGIDLQPLVHQARAGSGDTSIDHRRTEVLRRFFAKAGASLPVTPFAEDYQPGDIVTYYRPQNRRTRSHIAVVSSVMAPSGRPMVVHNRGWGPQLEDALFVDEITGHYRYRGPTTPATQAAQSMPASAKPTAGPAGVRSAVLPASFDATRSPSERPAARVP